MFTPIFNTGFRLSLRWLLVYPIILANWIIAYYLLADRLGWDVSYLTFIKGSLAAAFIMNTLIAIVVGLSVYVDDVTNGTDKFLYRLPLSRTRILQEKFLAGLSYLLLLYLVAVIYHMAFMPEGVSVFESNLDRDIGNYRTNLFVAMFSAYIFSIGISLLIQQQILVFIAAFLLEVLMWTGLQVVLTQFALNLEGAFIALTYLFLFFVLPVVLVWKKWNLALNPSFWGTPQSRTLFKGLVWKHVAQDGMLNGIAIGLFLATGLYALLGPDTSSIASRLEVWEIQNGIPYLFMVALALFLPVAAGAGAYSSMEGQGLDCVMYLHPVFRTQLFFSKIVAALPIMIISYFALLVTVGDRWSWISLLVWVPFSYSIALHISLWIRSVVLIILAAVSWAIFILSFTMIWMEETVEFLFFGAWVPVNDVQIVALLPLSLLTFGGIVSSWHMAINRKFLASSDAFKMRFNVVELAAVYAFTIIGVGTAQLFFTL